MRVSSIPVFQVIYFPLVVIDIVNVESSGNRLEFSVRHLPLLCYLKPDYQSSHSPAFRTGRVPRALALNPTSN